MLPPEFRRLVESTDNNIFVIFDSPPNLIRGIEIAAEELADEDSDEENSFFFFVNSNDRPTQELLSTLQVLRSRQNVDWQALFSLWRVAPGMGTSRSGPIYAAQRLLKKAKTLRERAFCRLLIGIEDSKIKFLPRINEDEVVLDLKGKEPRNYLAAVRRDRKLKMALSHIPFQGAPINRTANVELVPALQDLADLISWESTRAWTDKYFPGIPGMLMDPDHVAQIIHAMQRELEREGVSRDKKPLKLHKLSKERQLALAQRRRYWFAKFGITPENWKRGTWSVWDVSNEPAPDGPRYYF